MKKSKSRPEIEPDYEPTPEELAKAERHTWIIYGVMIVMVIAPFIFAWFLR